MMSQVNSLSSSHKQDAVEARGGVVHVARSVARQSYGVGEVARALAAEHRRLGWRAVNWSTDSREELVKLPGYDPALQVGFAARGPSRFGWSRALNAAAVSRLGEEFDVWHQHSVWSAASLATLAWRRRYNRPTVVSPHGALDAWTLRRSRWKKAAAWNLFEARNLASAGCIHALTDHELASLRDLGISSPIAVVNNGVSDEWLESEGDAARFRSRYGLANDARTMLFLSRVTPKKGLALFIAAMAGRRDLLDDWRLVIAGPDERGHAAELQRQISDCGLESRVVFTGPLFDEDRRDAFSEAALVVLPTHSEGSPMVVLEGLAVGKPVLTTVGAPAGFLGLHGCGWQTEVSVEGMQSGLDEALRLEDRQLAELGRRGQSLVKRTYAWKTAAERLLALYRWLARSADRPDFVDQSPRRRAA
ncbi:MAG: glycosyltransferase [Planctomycetales bacterium]|nr:glycosyltransferase [Planctomycetales bacterium]